MINTKCLSLGLDISLRTFLTNNQIHTVVERLLSLFLKHHKPNELTIFSLFYLTPPNLLGYYTSAPVQGDMKGKKSKPFTTTNPTPGFKPSVFKPRASNLRNEILFGTKQF